MIQYQYASFIYLFFGFHFAFVYFVCLLSSGYSDVAVEGEWNWITCESPDQWQDDLWQDGYPRNGQHDCGVFDPDTMEIYDDVCDVMDINFICEVTPKGAILCMYFYGMWLM